MRKKISEKIRGMVKESYESISCEFDQTRKRQWPEFRHFSKFVKNDAKVLDLGCGNGRLFELLKSDKAVYLGVDNNSAMLEKARNNFPDAKFQFGDMTGLDLTDNSFDLVFSVASFHHIPGRRLRRKTADEMHRVLKPDGILILTVWNLFQLKYIPHLLKACVSFILHFGLKNAWNDLWIKWGDSPLKRYYHAFLPCEILSYFRKKSWKIEEFYFSRNGSRVKFLRSFNICLIARKI